jgi:DNA-binding NtrC family response regulator
MSTSRNVLVCEDDPVQLRVLEAALHRAGYGTRVARSPGEALAAMKGRRTDAVVADVQLDRGNAFDLVEGLRRARQDVPVIMMSAYATPGMRQRAVAAGVVNFFEKPCDLGDVVRSVDQAVAESCREKIQARVLLVEDHPLMRTLYSAFLRQEGCEVLTVEDGVRALEILRADPAVDMALMDMHVPGPSGGVLVEEMRRVVPGLFVAMVTGEASHEEIQKGYRSGASALLRKPVARQDLIAFVKASLAKVREMHRAAERARIRAAEPQSRRAVRWVRSYLSAPKGSRKHKHLVILGVGAAFVLMGVFAASVMDLGVRNLDEVKQRNERILDKVEQDAGRVAREMQAYQAAQMWNMSEQVRQADEANELTHRLRK